MTTSKWWTCALIAAVVVTGAAVSRAEVDSPKDLADACLAKATRTASLTVEANHITADRAVWRIRALLREGKGLAARKLAGEAGEAIRDRSGEAIETIRTDRERCAKLLREMGHPRLALKVQAGCTVQIDRIRQSRNRTLGRILAPFGGDR